MTTDTSASIIVARKSTHGDFKDVAEIYANFMNSARGGKSFAKLSDVQRMSLEMIFHKAARVVCGNPDFDDHWLDIEGYARLAREKK